MTIQTYRDEYRTLIANHKAGLLDTSDFIKEMAALNESYLEGKGSFLLPVVL